MDDRETNVRRSEALLSIFLLAAVVWFARFSHSSGFGLYEDDWTRLPHAIELNTGELIEFLFENVSGFRGQGRPLHQSFIYIGSAMGWAAGRLQGIYVTGYLVVLLNVVLFYFLGRRIHGHAFGLVGALAFALYSADSTQAFITHSLGLQPSLTLFLLATHAYISRTHWLAYAFLLTSLLTYETPYFVFVGAPLLTHPPRRVLGRRLAVNAAIMAALFLAVFILRLAIRDFDPATISPSGLLSVALSHMLEGPVWGVGSYAYRTLETIHSMDLRAAAAVALSFPVFLAVLSRLATHGGASYPSNHPTSEEETSSVRRADGFRRALERLRNDGSRKMLILVGASIVMLIMAYPLTLTTNPHFVFGRVTRVHFAAVVGHSILVASVWTLGIGLARRGFPRFALSGILALGFSFMMGFGQVLQGSYVGSWDEQKALWGELLAVAPDAGDGTAIVVDSSGLKAGLHIGSNSWAMPMVLQAILHLPSDWKAPPSAYRMNNGWLEHLDAGNGTLFLGPPATDTTADNVRSVSSADLILIVTDGGRIARQDSPIEVGGQTYPVRPRSEPVLTLLERRPLFDWLISDPPG